MEHYTDLAFRYIKMNRRRSLLTVLGVAVSVMFLYILLNLGLSYLQNYREYLRERSDYEIVLFPENEDQISEILQDARVKDGTVADYYRYDYYHPVTYENALFINTTNPYRMDGIFESLKAKYGVEGQLHQEMAVTYLQGEEGSFAHVMILIALLVSYIIAIFGVGLVRNSIQLGMLERIQDFGQLRCIGSTKRQMKGIIYLQGLILELAGILAGTVFGVLGSRVCGALLDWEHTGFHALPLAFILVAFLGDLYFAMGENAKLVADMTPVSAIRGEYRIRKEKLKRRKSGLIGKIFGMEGDYAWKNIRRSPGRFRRTIGAMTLGVAMAIIISGVLSTLSRLKQYAEQQNGYYHVYYAYPMMPWESESDVTANLPEYGMMEQVSAMPGLASAKRIYTAILATSDWKKEVVSHYTEDYAAHAHDAEARDLDNPSDGNEDFYEFQKLRHSMVAVCGYDKEDLSQYQDTLIDGRLPEQENEILVPVSNYTSVYDERSDQYMQKFQRYLDYQVGDTIEAVNPVRLRERILAEMAPVEDKYREDVQRLEKKQEEAERKEDEKAVSDISNQMLKLDGWYQREQWNIRGRCYRQLVEEKDVVTFTVCGTVEGDVNQGSRLSYVAWETGLYYEPVVAIVPKEAYLKLMGVEENAINGMQYHFDRFHVSRFYDIDAVADEEAHGFGGVSTGGYQQSDYPFWMEFMQQIKGVLLVAGFVVLFLVSMTVVNTYNAAASSLHMRRKELAQLRVLGASRREVFRIVMLEGVLEAVISCLLGVLLGAGVSLGIFYGIFIYFEAVEYVFPWAASVLSVAAVTLILCGAVYGPLKRMPNDVAQDLTTGADS